MNTEMKVGKYLGRVNWFNTRRGYGFILILNEDKKDEEVFVHQTSIVSNNYRTLYPGEYVSLDVVQSEEDSNKMQCSNVRGVCGGSLLTENNKYYFRVFEKESVRRDRDESVNARESEDSPVVKDDSVVESDVSKQDN
jgi:cold shock protein